MNPALVAPFGFIVPHPLISLCPPWACSSLVCSRPVSIAWSVGISGYHWPVRQPWYVGVIIAVRLTRLDLVRPWKVTVWRDPWSAVRYPGLRIGLGTLYVADGIIFVSLHPQSSIFHQMTRNSLKTTPYSGSL